MSMTDEQFKNQEALIGEMEKELNRMNGEFDKGLKEAGVTLDDLKEVDMKTLPPEVRAVYEEAAARAERAGRERAGQFETAHGINASKAGAGRKDVVRL